MLRFVRIRRSHARRFVPGVNERQLRKALAYVSCIRSSASSREPTRCRATRKTWSDSSSASSSKRTRSRSSSAMRLAWVWVGSFTSATLPMRLFSLERGEERAYSPYKEARMHGNDVVTIDGDKIGHVVDERDGYLIVEHGLLKTKHALPQKFVEEHGESGSLRTTLSKELVHGSPKVNGDFDREAI